MADRKEKTYFRRGVVPHHSIDAEYKVESQGIHGHDGTRGMVHLKADGNYPFYEVTVIDQFGDKVTFPSAQYVGIEVIGDWEQASLRDLFVSVGRALKQLIKTPRWRRIKELES